MVMRSMLFAICALVLLMAMPSYADAAQPSSGCSLGGAAIAFGTYDPLSATPLDTAGSLVYRCGQKEHNIMISLSQGGSGSFAARRMVAGVEQLFYNLYQNAGRTVIWGDGTGGSQALFVRNPQGNNQDITVPFFGRVTPLQNAGVGNYSDTITVTLTF